MVGRCEHLESSPCGPLHLRPGNRARGGNSGLHVTLRNLLAAARSASLCLGSQAARLRALEGHPGPQPPIPCSLLLPLLLLCPSPGAALPAAASPLPSGAASSPIPRGPAPGSRLQLRVTILMPEAFMPSSSRQHIPAAPAAPAVLSRDSTLAQHFRQS